VWTLLRGSRSFRTLWVARTVSFLGDSLSLVALMLHVADTTGQALAVALLLLVGDFAPSLLSPLTGTISDRWDLKRVMVVCELAHEALGPLLAAALFPLLDVRGVLLVDAATFLVSAVVLAGLPRLAPASAGPGARASFLADARAGVGYIWSVPTVRVIVLGFCAVVACNGVDDVALVFLATESLGGGQSAVAVLLAAVGIGLLVGYLLLARTAGRLPMVAAFLVGLGVSSAGNLLSGLAWAVSAAFVLQTVRGVGIAAMDVSASTLLQRLVAPAMLGRVFGNLHGAIGVAAALSYLLGGLLLDLTSPRVTLVAAGAGGLLATLVTVVAFRRSVDRVRGGQRR
jgi:MFS family permease